MRFSRVRALPALVLAAYVAVLSASPVGEALRLLVHITTEHSAVAQLPAVAAQHPVRSPAMREELRAEDVHHHHDHGEGRHHQESALPASEHDHRASSSQDAPGGAEVGGATIAFDAPHEHDGRLHTHAPDAAEDPVAPTVTLEEYYPVSNAAVPLPVQSRERDPFRVAISSHQSTASIELPPPRRLI